jgi:hypothetical protein
MQGQDGNYFILLACIVSATPTFIYLIKSFEKKSKSYFCEVNFVVDLPVII